MPESWCSREENVHKIHGAHETRVDFVHLSIGDRAALRTIVSFRVKLKLPYEAYALRGAPGRGWRSLRFRMLPGWWEGPSGLWRRLQLVFPDAVTA